MQENDSITAKVNFNIYDVTVNCNAYITQYLKKWKQSDTEMWSANRI